MANMTHMTYRLAVQDKLTGRYLREPIQEWESFDFTAQAPENAALFDSWAEAAAWCKTPNHLIVEFKITHEVSVAIKSNWTEKEDVLANLS